MLLISDNKKIMNKESFYAPEARILVVDDTRLNLIVIKGLLKQTGMQVDTADSGRECLFLVGRNKYHIIFLDIKMPEMDGIETLHRLLTLEEEKYKNIPVIALTADNSGTGKYYIKEGFDDYLSKPIDSKELIKSLLKYLPQELVQEIKDEEKDTPIPDDCTDEMTDITGLNAVMGIQSCGSVETFQKALKEFYMTASTRIQEIEYYISIDNYNDFTIKVHALKSSARLIGAMKLSEMARYLEECSNHEHIREIKHKTIELIEQYRELEEAIGVYVNKKEENHERPIIERGSLMDAFHTIYEFVEVFDFNSADNIIEMLDEYTIPDEYHEVIQKLKVLLIDVERDEVMRYIKTIEEQACSEPAKNGDIDIPGIDVKSALEALGGSVEDYIKILKVFTKDEKERIKQMDECIRTKNIELYTIYAHSIKSSAAIIGSLELSRLAQKLEMAGKEKNFEYIHENHNEFLIKINQVIEGLIYFLQQCSSQENQGKEQGSKEFLLKNLEMIECALMEYEMNMAEEALNGINNMQWSKAISIILSEIEQKMMAFEYEDARVLVSKLLKMEVKEI